MTDKDTSPAEAQTPVGETNQLAKLAVELGPLLVFFVTNSRAGIFWGTGLFIGATIVSLICVAHPLRQDPGDATRLRVLRGCVRHSYLVAAERPLHQAEANDRKSDLRYRALWRLLANKSLLRYIFGEVFRLSEEGWRKLTFRWATFFVVLALLNELAWRFLSTDTWVSFKVFAVMPLTMLFAITRWDC